MARAKLKIGETCKGKYGPHFIGSETDLELGRCIEKISENGDLLCLSESLMLSAGA
jgi:hypothetical protein